MLARLPLIRLTPRWILDAGCGTGEASGRLPRYYPKARVIALDLSLAMLMRARRRGRPFRRPYLLAADLARLPLATGSIDLVYSNLTLPWIEATTSLTELRRVMAGGGLLMFATLGPATLQELRAARAAVDNVPHVAPFPDLHSLGDTLLARGFAEPVLDTERLTLTYPDLDGLLADLRGMGLRHGLDTQRRTLTGKGRLAALRQGYERYRDGQTGRLPATFEISYGHAWVPDRPLPQRLTQPSSQPSSQQPSQWGSDPSRVIPIQPVMGLGEGSKRGRE